MQLGEVKLLQRTTEGPSQPQLDPTLHKGRSAIGNLCLSRSVDNRRLTGCKPLKDPEIRHVRTLSGWMATS